MRSLCLGRPGPYDDSDVPDPNGDARADDKEYLKLPCVGNSRLVARYENRSGEMLLQPQMTHWQNV